MPAIQARLFPDPQPLVDRLGREFFRQLPPSPGVYLMRDARNDVLYVGKARSLRHRLGSYRVANPERMARRTLRLLRLVERIELELCPDEPAALRRESELLLALKPRFNRAGVWQGPGKFLAWRETEAALELIVSETPPAGWQQHGPLGSQARWLRKALARLLWLRMNPGRDITDLPAGWSRGHLPEVVALRGKQSASDWLPQLLLGECQPWLDWLGGTANLHPFTRQWIREELESISTLAGRPTQPAGQE